MIKKSFLALFTSLIIGGLLMVWSTNAMTYTVNGNQTNIGFIKNETINEIKINWWDNSETNLTSCSTENIWWVYYYLCTKEYNDGLNTHNITIKNSDNSDNNRNQTIYLVNANVDSINDFDGFLNLKTLRLNHNNITTLNYNKLGSFHHITVYMDENSYNDYNNVSYYNFTNIDTLYLRNNNLTTIPKIIRKNKDSYQIILDSDHIYQPTKSNIIDLSNNYINFIWITGIGSEYHTYDPDSFNWFENTTTYKFEWFAYSHNTSPLQYNWWIYTGENVEPIAFPETLTTSQSVTYEQALLPWNYIFKVLYNDGQSFSHTDSINFTVDYNEAITIASPDNQESQEYDSLNIIWKRWRVWNYPETILSWYKYILEKWSETIKEWSINISDANGDCGGLRRYNCADLDIWSIIENEINENNLNGEYTLTVYLIDKDWGYATSNGSRISDTASFIINIADEPATITISKPEPNGVVSTQTVEFEWNWVFPSSSHTYILDHYEYSVTWPHSYSTWGSTNDTSFQLKDLSDGTYSFTITMYYTEYYTDNTEEKSVTKTISFEMAASESPNLSITSPISWANITGTNATEINIPFTWNWWATLFHRYHYTLKDSSNHELTGWNVTINDAAHRQFSYNLWNGTYTFEVKMYNSSNAEIKSDSSTFTVNIPSTLNIISPTSGNHSSATTTFSWEWFTPYTFTNYKYTVTWPNWFSVWPTTTGGTSFSIKNLRDGSYTFTVTMNYIEWSTPKTLTKTRNFTVNASAWAIIQITSPNKSIYTGNYIKTVPINFTWNWGGSPLISKYSYEIKDRGASILRAAGYVNENNLWSYSIPGRFLALPSGKYIFEVTMLDDENNPIIDEPASYGFDVVIPSYLEILTPPAWQLNIKDVTFSRSWFAEFQDHYKYELKKINPQNNATIITWKSNTQIKNFSLQNLHNGKYTFSVEIMDEDNNSIIKKEKTFRIPDDLDLILDISDWNSSVTTLRSRKWIFSWGWKSEDFAGYSYSIQGTTFKNETYLYTWRSEWITTWTITLNDLSTGRYRFTVNMLNASGWIITWKHIDFNVVIPASLKINSPTSWSTITSSSATFKWDWYSDVITRYEYSLTSSGWYSNNWFTTANSFSRNDLTNWNYTLVVRLASGSNFVAEDTVHFTVNIPQKSSGGWGGSSSKSHKTNDLSVSITNDEPTTNERVEVVVDISDKYTWKVDFTKMQYYSFDEEKRIDIPVTSKNYVSNYSDDAKLGYVKFDSSDEWEKNLSEFLMFSQPGNYRIHVEDKDWYKEYTEFYVWKWNNKTQVTTTKEPADEDEYYIARSCKKYKIEYLDNLGVYSSPNLKKEEYFISKDYFKRYIDSKNKQIEWCPTNVWWISTTYKDTSNSSDKYAAPNGKVYFINGQNWSYSSTQLDKELNGAKRFSTINELKYFIRDRNPFINMSAPVK